MMAVSRDPNAYAFIHALEAPARARLSSRTLIALGVAGVLHVGLGAYLYTQKMHPGLDEAPSRPNMQVSTIRWPAATPPPAPHPASHAMTPRHEAAVDAAQNPQTLAVPPQNPTQSADPTPTTADAAQEPPKPRLIGDPEWVSRPSAAQMARFYPPQALEDGLAGKAVLMCAVSTAGSVSTCQVVSETPARAGFGQAALKLSGLFRMSPRTENGQPVEGGVVRIAIVFNAGE